MSGTARRRSSSEVLLVSGIPAGEGGTGQLVAHLEARLVELGLAPFLPSRPERVPPWEIRDLLRQRRFGQLRRRLWRQAGLLVRFWLGILRVALARQRPLLMMHPQNLGYRLALLLLRHRAVPATLYLLDSAYFCVRSYNHREGEYQACLECIEHGTAAATRHGCHPFPRPDPEAFRFADALQALVRAGRVRVVAQNERQASQAQRALRLPTRPPVAGLWTLDWDELCAPGQPGADPHAPAPAADEPPWDVVFHGHVLEAKGAAWLVAVARHAPQLRFLFPGVRPAWLAAPDNCHFIPCTWDSGLRERVMRARVVAVPSLWSAPIEGALLKSIALARAVAVVDNPASYCDELPEGLVLKLPVAPPGAAQTLARACAAGWRPDARTLADWMAELPGRRAQFVPRLLQAAAECAAAGSCGPD